MVDQFILYDQALSTWLTTYFGTLIPGKTPQLLLATPKRSFADVMTGRTVDNRTFTLPRMCVTRLGDKNDPSRFNSNKLRRLGWKQTDVWSALRQAQHPAPISISYQLDFYTKYVKEMNIWEQKLHLLMAQSFLYLQIKPDDVYGYKMYPVFFESGIDDSSELEPGEGDRAIRKTLQLRADAWVFDQDFTSKKIIKRVRLEMRDYESLALYDTILLPPQEVVGVGTGAQVDYTFTVPRPPVLENTVVIEATVGGVTVIFIDDTSGNIVSDNDFVTVGTITYATGEVVMTFPTAPDLGESVIATYFTDLT